MDRIPRLILASAPLREAESVFADRPVEIGWVEVACLVDAEGVARETLVIEAMPASVDAQPLIALTRHSKFEPALQGGRAVAGWTGFNYRHRDDLVLNKRRKSTREFVTELEAAARAGDYVAQYQYARLASRFPKLEIPEGRWAAALARSAEEAHYPIALYHMRSHPAVLKKAGDASRTASRVWTQRAAQAGFGPAQLQIALTSWAEQTDAGRARAHLWLAAAAADGYLPAQKYLAALLLELERTEPGRSGIVQLVDSVLASAAYRSDPDVWQMRAVIHAAAGDWEAAIAAQEAATAFAETYKWPVDRFRARLAAFRKQTQPDGDLIVLPALRVP